MDYKELVGRLNTLGDFWKAWKGDDSYFYDAATAITDLLASAEAAEARLAKAQEELDKMEQLHEDARRELGEAKARAEKAEKERDAAVNDLGRIKSCKVCNHCDSLKTLIPEVCKKCHHGDKWEWRGQKEE